ncbi:hypothetical protein Syun_004009 [Stephania yunnanensis]|uniref:Uncharacterized protein n=1 Tax=Stephania yunnanensis TaxID=152371 RepID=A0AAP0L275_9MAGN
MGTLKDWVEFKNGDALYGSVSTLDGVGWSAVDTDADHAYYFVHGLLDSIGSGVVTTARIHDQSKTTVRRSWQRDPIECTDRDIDLVVHRDKDMDMVHLDRDFNVSAWCVLCLEVSEEPSLSRRSHLVAEEPSPIE